MKALNTSRAPAAIGPYSQALHTGNTVYVSGQLPVNPETGELETDIRQATAQCLQNITAILTEANFTLANSVRMTVYLADIADFSAMNEVYAGFFTQPFPARVAIQVAALPKNARIEIDCIASGE
jgi:2-iminobutanoate/2-iminopropanoate deaminase